MGDTHNEEVHQSARETGRDRRRSDVASGAAHAELGWKAGEWNLAFSGNVNAFYVHASCDNSSTSVGGAIFVCQQVQDSSSVQNGFLPASLVFPAKTRKFGLDLGVKIGFSPGLPNQPASTGFGVPKIDARQLYMTLGDKRWGSIKLGRDQGLFAVDTTFEDMHVPGLGAGAGGVRPGYATFVRVGVPGLAAADHLFLAELRRLRVCRRHFPSARDANIRRDQQREHART